jgi:hypothetical protein
MLPSAGGFSRDGTGGEAVEQAIVISARKRINTDFIDIRNLTSLQSQVTRRIG